jgi:hypothetical protein
MKGINLKKGPNNSNPEDVPIQPTYTLPFGEKLVSHDVVFGLRGENSILLRPWLGLTSPVYFVN